MLELHKSQPQLVRELESDLAHLRKKACRYVDMLVLVQSDIMLLRARLTKLKQNVDSVREFP